MPRDTSDRDPRYDILFEPMQIGPVTISVSYMIEGSSKTIAAHRLRRGQPFFWPAFSACPARPCSWREFFRCGL